MLVIKTLRNFLKLSLPGIHAKRLKALMAAVEAGLSGTSLSITALGRALSGTAFIKHKIKRMDRLFGNSHLGNERMAIHGVMTHWLLKSMPLPIILFDWSPLGWTGYTPRPKRFNQPNNTSKPSLLFETSGTGYIPRPAQKTTP